MRPAIGGPPRFANSAAYSPDQLSVERVVVDDQRVAFVDREQAVRPVAAGVEGSPAARRPERGADARGDRRAHGTHGSEGDILLTADNKTLRGKRARNAVAARRASVGPAEAGQRLHPQRLALLGQPAILEAVRVLRNRRQRGRVVLARDGGAGLPQQAQLGAGRVGLRQDRLVRRGRRARSRAPPRRSARGASGGGAATALTGAAIG